MLRVAPVVFPTRRARHGRRDARDAPEPELDLDLDPVIKNDAIVIEDDTDTDTDTTASGDTVVEVVDSPVRCIDVSGTAESESPIPWDGPWHHCSRYGYEVFGGDDSSRR